MEGGELLRAAHAEAQVYAVVLGIVAHAVEQVVELILVVVPGVIRQLGSPVVMGPYADQVVVVVCHLSEVLVPERIWSVVRCHGHPSARVGPVEHGGPTGHGLVAVDVIFNSEGKGSGIDHAEELLIGLDAIDEYVGAGDGHPPHVMGGGRRRGCGASYEECPHPQQAEDREHCD